MTSTDTRRPLWLPPLVSSPEATEPVALTEPEDPSRPARPSPTQPARTPQQLNDDIARLRRCARDTTEAATRAQHARGKLTARERLAALFDPDTLVELDTFRRHNSHHPQLSQRRPHTDGVVTGWGRVNGRVVFAYAQDFRIFGGSLGEQHAQKIVKLMDLAFEARKPIVALNDGGGARIQEGVSALAGYGEIFRRNVRASGVIPQISVILGPCAGGAAYSPSLTDVVMMVDETSQMFVTGPSVLESALGESVSAEALGGSAVHAARSGVAHARYQNEQNCLADVRYLLSMLPDSSGCTPPGFALEDPIDRATPELLDLVPAEPHRGYDVRDVIGALVDDGETFELHEEWAPTLVCAFARLGGRTVGIVANQPQVNAGVLDIDSSQKGARFVQTCDAFRIPIVTLVDVPGFLPGVDQEHGGIIRHGAKLLYAYCAATVPRISLILRKAYGGAYIVMDSRSIGADLAFAWPTNEVAVMGAASAVEVINAKDLAAAQDREGLHAHLVAEYNEEFLDPLYAAERGLVDEVIDPVHTRRTLIESLHMLAGKTRACGDGPGNPPQ